ncbi:hypothetical protein H072_6283 [Dactylellina haptotyla CBS 200.50]|uniref:LDB19 N-terminal domain-containing protein n=1 Tax=Dactylellina haptotyla (strain CBS 200.50) TaxID=1284197 RepID=S8AFH2_DACHA|nr:hypothetical protein H072_6283 [Dactylellina haptotyla CBS 200.50]
MHMHHRNTHAKGQSPQLATRKLCPSLELDFIPDVANSIICVGSHSDSEGSLLSGYVNINVKADESITISDLAASIVLTETLSDPAIRGCKSCSTKTLIVDEKVIFKSRQVLLEPGLHSYPLILHVPGNMPATHHDEQRQMDYTVSMDARTISGEVVNSKKSLSVSRLCPVESDSKQVRSASQCFIANIMMPTYTSPDEKQVIELDLRTKEVTGTTTRTLWQARKIRWEIIECTQDIRLPCEEHAGVFRDQHRSTLREERHEVFAQELDLHREGDALTLPFDKMETFSLPFRVKRGAVTDVTTHNGYKIWHVVKIRILFAYLKLTPKQVPYVNDFDLYNLKWLEITESINLNQKNNCGETKVQSWDEEVAPPYTCIEFSPPPGY